MNERIEKLAEQCGLRSNPNVYDRDQSFDIERFAELIVKECIEQGKQIQSQSVSNGSEEYNTGREMGIEVFLNQIKKHFGVAE